MFFCVCWVDLFSAAEADSQLQIEKRSQVEKESETKTKISFLQLRKPLSSLSIGGGANGASMPKKVITKNNKFEVIILWASRRRKTN